MELNGKIWLAKSDEKVFLEPKMANRHGFIAGASGTGKTITLKVLAESFSQLGVPVFLADIKGDLAGMCKAGVHSESMEKRINKLGIEDWRYRVFPTRFWDIYGEYGHPVRTTVSEMGPMLLSRLMDLSDVQSDVLNLVFKIADDKGLLLIDIKDLKAMLRYVGENRAEFSAEYGNMSAQSLGAIQRSLITLEDEGGAEFFGEPAIDIRDWMQRDEQGRGYINVLHSVKLVQNPTLYATFMLFLMSELFEKLPERGDAESRRWCSSLMRRIFCSATRRRCLCRKSSRWLSLSAQRALAYISFRKARRTFRTVCLRSFQTACSMRSGHIRQANRRL